MEQELITIAEASKLIGKSQQTIRRWKTQGKLEFEKQSGDTKAYLNRGKLLAVAGLLITPPQMTKPPAQNEEPEAMKVLKEYLSDTKAERDRLQSEVNRLRSELQDKQTRINALETELNGGFRGLLRNLRK